MIWGVLIGGIIAIWLDQSGWSQLFSVVCGIIIATHIQAFAEGIAEGFEDE